MSDNDVRNDTLLSTIQKSLSLDLPSLGHPPIHPFGDLSWTQLRVSQLKDLEQAATTLQTSLTAYLNYPITDPKLVSTLRQHSSIAYDLEATEKELRRRVQDLKKGGGTKYGEDVPIDKSLVADWCIARIEQWGKAAGMESFKDEEKDNKVTLVMGGKVLVVDIDFAFDRTSSSYARVDIAHVKVSHALPSGNSGQKTSSKAASLGGFLKHILRHFLEEVQQEGPLFDTTKAVNIGQEIGKHWMYLMKLDNLASQEGGKGIQWFQCTDEVAQITEKLLPKETPPFARELSASSLPLDIYLLRSHALLMPYLSTPSINFLVYLSPLAYLTLVRHPQSKPASKDPRTSHWLDISLPLATTALSLRDTRPQGTILASLCYVPHERIPEQTIELAKPSSTLSPLSAGPTAFTNVFSDLQDAFDSLSPTMTTAGSTTQQQITGSGQGSSSRPPGARPALANVPAELIPELEKPFPLEEGKKGEMWVLDFTDGGNTPGIVMSKSRMRDIHGLLDPIHGLLSPGVELMSYGYSGSNWVDMLFNHPSSQFAPMERLVAVYNSPSNLHPPLHLRLNTPTEPGFFLARVPVRHLKEAFGVLEIVRDQCWLNETLKSLKWMPESEFTTMETMENYNTYGMEQTTGVRTDPQALEAQLASLLDGSYNVRRVPVNVFLPTQQPAEAIYDEDDPMGALAMPTMVPAPPRFVMTFPTHEVQPSQLTVTVSHDVNRSRGVRIDVAGSLPLRTEQVTKLEEFARRGGILGLAGQVWNMQSS